MKEVTDFLGSLWGLPGAVLTALLCLCAGYGLKKIKRYPNEAIPLTIMLLGAGINLLMADPMLPPLSMRLWVVKNLVIGFIAGFVAWLSHKGVMKMLTKLPIFSNDDDSSPEAFVKPKVDADPKP